MYNLLTEDIIRTVKHDDEMVKTSLPKILGALMRDEIASFPALRPHQRHAWHAFLVQLGTIALSKNGLDVVENDAEWEGVIRSLTPEWENDDPWQLVVDDITQPAFMQSPASSSDLIHEFKNVVDTPDGIDMLVTSKNHDIKGQVAYQSEIDDWMMALITLQTMDGYSGSGNNGISRMNGGLGSRVALSLAPRHATVGQHIRHDIEQLLDSDLEDRNINDTNGIDLLWLSQWDGTKAEALRTTQLHPLYIEICRRIRLRSNKGRINCLKATSKSQRIESKEMKGVIGDPWVPINVKESKALTLSINGFGYKQVADYLVGDDYDTPLLCKPPKSDIGNLQLVARGMVRGQGETNGYHERIIPISFKVATIFSNHKDVVGGISKDRIDEISRMSKILRGGILKLLDPDFASNKPPTESAYWDVASLWGKRFDKIIDANYFDDLQVEIIANENEKKEIRDKWLMDVVIGNADMIFNQAVDSASKQTIGYHKSRARAERLYNGWKRGNKGFPSLFTDDRKEIA